MDGTAIELLGGLSVRIGGTDVTAALGGRVGRLALAYLVLHRDRAVRRDELADAVWEAERAPADPDAALRVVLSRLRSALGRDAVTGRAELRLALPEPARVDLEELRELVAEGEAEAARAAARLAARELLPGLDADWLAAERDALLELRAQALLTLGRADPDAALDAGRELIALAPFRESGHRLRIEALAARGELAEALRAYDELRVLLRDELGTAPSPELAALHVQLLRSTDPGAGAPIPALAVQRPLPAAAAPDQTP